MAHGFPIYLTPFNLQNNFAVDIVLFLQMEKTVAETVLAHSA